MEIKELFLKNYEAIENAEKMGLPIPDAQRFWDYFYFDLELLISFSKSEDGNININLPDGKHTLKYSEELWDYLITFMKYRNQFNYNKYKESCQTNLKDV